MTRTTLAPIVSFIFVISCAARASFAQAIAEPDIDRAGSPAVQGIRQNVGEAHVEAGDRLTGDWFGSRYHLVERGITFEASLIADYSRNLRGGLDTESDAFRHLFDVSLTLESKPLLGYDGGKFFIEFQTESGRNGIDELTGDFQGFDNIDSDGLTSLYECWYEQVLAGGTLRVKVGKLDINGEFAFVQNGSDFIHSSPGADPAIIGYPTYPDPATSFNIFVYPVKGLYLGAGVYDGATQDDHPTGMHGPSTFFGEPSDLFLISEIGYGWDGGPGRLDGRLGVGISHHTGTFDILDKTGHSENGASSAFLTFDQTLWRENPADKSDTQGVRCFIQLGFGEEDIAPVDTHVGSGVVWAGLIPRRDNDDIGLGLSYVHFSHAARNGGFFTEDYELAIELYYKLALTPWLNLKPDLQYIVNPGGNGNPDALVATLRAEVAF